MSTDAYIFVFLLRSVMSQIKQCYGQMIRQPRCSGQVGPLSQAIRTAACISFGENISAKCVHLTSLYPMALTLTNDDFTVLHHVCTWCKIMQHLHVNFGRIWRFELVLCDTWNWNDDNDTVSVIAILDTTMIPEMHTAQCNFNVVQNSPVSEQTLSSSRL